jgi:hypothetical protein
MKESFEHLQLIAQLPNPSPKPRPNSIIRECVVHLCHIFYRLVISRLLIFLNDTALVF